jgi:hypothetical protein
MERIQVRTAKPPVLVEREDVGDQVGDAIIDLASAPRGGVFSCRWNRRDGAVYWGYVWVEANGCRSALAGRVMTFERRIPMREVEVEDQDRHQGLPDSLSGWEARVVNRDIGGAYNGGD